MTVRQLASTLLRFSIRHASPKAREWGQAMLREMDFVRGDWAALFWAIESAAALLLRRHASMSHKQRTTVFGIVFWTLLLASVGLVDRYRWLQAAWVFVWIGFPVVAAVSSIVEMYRKRRYSNGYVYYLPRWVMWVVLDDEQYDKYLQRRRLTAPE
jgi:hypothetical protein